MSRAIPLRFIQIGGRRVSWRCVGTGPAALLLHGSPQSSRALAGVGQAVAAAGQCAVMPDTPGAGHSEPVAEPPQAPLAIEDLADALAEFADAIGLRRVSLYGSHTGAAIACAFAARYPQRVTALVLDGIAAWTDAERSSFKDSYAPAFLPSWDGAHMTWLWSRMEAQSVFFPWHRQQAVAWRQVDLSPPWHLHRNAMDMLDSGDAYRAIYQASLAFDPQPALAAVAVPVRMIMASADVLKRHAGRPALQHLQLDLFDDPARLWAAVATALAAQPGDPAPPFAAPGLFWRGTLQGAGRPRVLLHQAGASSRVFEDILAEPAAGPMIAFDLPGHGFSGGELPGNAAEIALLISAECRKLGLQSYHAAGRRFGGVVAQAMASGDVETGYLERPSTAPHLAELGTVDLDPVWDGSHLLRAWRVAYRQALWDPWYEPVNATAREPPSDLRPAAIHAAAVDLLRAGPAWRIANTIEAQQAKL